MQRLIPWGGGTRGTLLKDQSLTCREALPGARTRQQTIEPSLWPSVVDGRRSGAQLSTLHHTAGPWVSVVMWLGWGACVSVWVFVCDVVGGACVSVWVCDVGVRVCDVVVMGGVFVCAVVVVVVVMERDHVCIKEITCVSKVLCVRERLCVYGRGRVREREAVWYLHRDWVDIFYRILST